MQVLELSKVTIVDNIEEDPWEEEILQFQKTFRALGQLTSLSLSDVISRVGMSVLPADDIGHLTNLRYVSHLCGQRHHRGSAACALARA